MGILIQEPHQRFVELMLDKFYHARKSHTTTVRDMLCYQWYASKLTNYISPECQ